MESPPYQTGQTYQPYQPYQYNYPPYYNYNPPVQKSTNGLAIASLVCSLAGIAVSIVPIVGIILGFVALNQINKEPYKYEGKGMAMAGVIIGFCVVGFRGIIMLIYLYFFFFLFTMPY